MLAATAAQPSSGHHKHYVPILAGILGGCGLILLLGCLAYMFMWRRPALAKNDSEENLLYYFAGFSSRDEGDFPTESFGRTSATSAWSDGAEDCVFGLPRPVSPGETPLSECALKGLPSVQGSVSRQSLQHEVGPSSPEFNTDLERGNSVNWDPNSDLLSLDALPFANIDLPTDFDIDYQNSNASTVPSSLSALPFANVDLQEDFSLDHQKWKAPTIPASSDVGLGLDKDFPAGCERASESSQPGMSSGLTPTPRASTNIPPTDLPLSPLQMTAVPPGSLSPLQMPQNNAYVPLPRAPNFRCSGCPRTFSSGLRLENHQKSHKKSLCDVVGCGKDFTTPKDLRRHRKTVHADKCANPSQVLRCEERDCGYTTRRKDHLKRHANSHRAGRTKEPEGQH